MLSMKGLSNLTGCLQSGVLLPAMFLMESCCGNATCCHGRIISDRFAQARRTCIGEWLLPLTLTVSDKAVFFVTTEAVISLDAQSGKPLWRIEKRSAFERFTWVVPTVVAYDGVLLVADQEETEASRGTPDSVKWAVRATMTRVKGATLVAYDTKTGQALWENRRNLAFIPQSLSL